MKSLVILTDEHVGKFTVIKAGDKDIPVQIISVGVGLCGWAVLDNVMPLRSGKVRYDQDKPIVVYDTAKEAVDANPEDFIQVET